jgi:hypothetical protein
VHNDSIETKPLEPNKEWYKRIKRRN